VTDPNRASTIIQMADDAPAPWINKTGATPPRRSPLSA
jgi:hypothetical protein